MASHSFSLGAPGVNISVRKPYFPPSLPLQKWCFSLYRDMPVFTPHTPLLPLVCPDCMDFYLFYFDFLIVFPLLSFTYFLSFLFQSSPKWHQRICQSEKSTLLLIYSSSFVYRSLVWFIPPHPSSPSISDTFSPFPSSSITVFPSFFSNSPQFLPRLIYLNPSSLIPSFSFLLSYFLTSSPSSSLIFVIPLFLLFFPLTPF